jgi:hypothetical protein
MNRDGTARFGKAALGRARLVVKAAAVPLLISATGLSAPGEAAGVETAQESLELAGVASSGFGAGFDVHGDVLVVAPEGEFAIRVFHRSPTTNSWSAGAVISKVSSATFPSNRAVVATDGARVFYSVDVTPVPQPNVPAEIELRVTSIASPTQHTVLGTYPTHPSSLAASGGFLAAGFPGSGLLPLGSVRIYELSGGVWSQQASFVDDDFNGLGHAVALVGTRVVAGSPTYGTNGAARVYSRGTSGWFEQQLLVYNPLLQSGARFGEAVALDGECLYVGVPGLNIGLSPSVPDVGGVRMYAWNPALPGFQARLMVVSEAPQEGAQLGSSVAAAGNTLVAGSPSRRGVFGRVQGAAHVFHRTGNDCGTGVRVREAFQLRSQDQLTPPNPVGELGIRVGVTAEWAFAGDPRARDDSGDGRVYGYLNVGVIFWDGFESGDTSRW